MPIPISVPRLGWNMEEGAFGGWLKQDGDQVRPGDALFALESEKATEEIEAMDAGFLRIPPNGPAPGDRLTVGAVIGYLVESLDEAVPKLVEVRVPIDTGPVVSRANEVHPDRSGKNPISPRARRAARELGIDWSGLRGTGRTGRVRERDVRAAVGRGEGMLIPLTSVRRTIASRLAESRQ